MIRQLVLCSFMLVSSLAFADGKTERLMRLQTTVGVLTSPQLEGRKAGTPGGTAAREWIKSEFRALGVKPLSDDYDQPIFQWITGKQIGTNAIGFLGPDPRTTNAHCVLIGAHYDGLGVSKSGKHYPGADDNASGVAALLDLAREIVSKENELQRCVVFGAWDYEEGSLSTAGGLKGSAYYAAHPFFPLRQIDLVLTFDLLGGHFFKGAERDLFVFGLESSKSLFSRFKNVAKNGLTIRPFLTAVLEPFGDLIPRSDYGPFRNAGVPYLFFSTGTPKYYHKTDDTFLTVDFEKLARVSSYLENYIEHFLYSNETLSREWDKRGVRTAQLNTGISLLQNLLSQASDNGITRGDRGVLRDDLIRLQWMRVNRASDYPSCWLQVTFMDILNSIGVLSNSGRWFSDGLALRCALE